MSDEPRLLRVPSKFQTVEAVLETARKMDLPNVLVLSELPDGSLVFLETEMTVASTNWLLDRIKMLILQPDGFSRRDTV